MGESYILSAAPLTYRGDAPRELETAEDFVSWITNDVDVAIEKVSERALLEAQAEKSWRFVNTQD